VAGIFAPHIDEAVGGTADEAGDNHGFNEIERVVLDEFTVFERGSLSFVRVADDYLVLTTHSPSLAPLAAQRIFCAAAATDFCLCEHGTNIFRVHIHGFAQSLKTANIHIGTDGGGVVLAKIFGQEFNLCAHTFPLLISANGAALRFFRCCPDGRRHGR